jgi:hypothetical protein
MNKFESMNRAELTERFRRTVAFKNYVARPKIRFEHTIDEARIRRELAERNQLRAEAKLPPVSFDEELNRLRATFESARSGEFYALAYEMICEVCGKPNKHDFSSVSDVAWFFSSKQNLIRDMLVQQIRDQTTAGQQSS